MFNRLGCFLCRSQTPEKYLQFVVYLQWLRLVLVYITYYQINELQREKRFVFLLLTMWRVSLWSLSFHIAWLVRSPKWKQKRILDLPEMIYLLRSEMAMDFLNMRTWSSIPNSFHHSFKSITNILRVDLWILTSNELNYWKPLLVYKSLKFFHRPLSIIA